MYRVRPTKAQHVWPPLKTGTSIDNGDGVNEEEFGSRRSSLAKPEDPGTPDVRKEPGSLIKKQKDLKKSKEPTTPNEQNDSTVKSPTTPFDKKDSAFKFKHAQLKFQGIPPKKEEDRPKLQKQLPNAKELPKRDSDKPALKKTVSVQEKDPPPSSKKGFERPLLRRVASTNTKDPPEKSRFEKPDLKKVPPKEPIGKRAEPEPSALKKDGIKEKAPSDKSKCETPILKKVVKPKETPLESKSNPEKPVLKKVDKVKETPTIKPDSEKPPLRKVIETPKPKELPNKPDWTRTTLKKVESKKPDSLKNPESNSLESDSKSGKSQNQASKMAATDCEWKRDAFGKQSRWSQSIENMTPEPHTPQTPQPIPSPPVDGKENLNKKSVRISKEKPATSDDTPKTSPPGKVVKNTKKFSNASKNEGSSVPPPPPANSNNSSDGVPPPPPPMPGMKTSKPLVMKTGGRNELVEQIKKATRTRPDWKTLMKDLEGGVKLKHVKSQDRCDRSSPILPENRGKGGKFLYDSEKPSPEQHQLLSEIQRGVKLRRVRTNDRSRPDFQKLGLRKVRRQMTAEEKKAIPPDAPEALPSSSDEEEDIDTMRDDLKATKSQLADEIKKSKQLEREIKIQQIDVDSYKAEVKKLKRQLKEAGVHEVKPIRNCEAADMAPKLSKSMSKLRMREEDLDFTDLDVIDDEIKSLQDQIDAQQKRAEKAEAKCDEANQKMKYVNNSSDEWELRSVYFEKKYKSLQKEQGIELPDINCIAIQTDPVEIVYPSPVSDISIFARKSASRKSLGMINKMQSFKEEDEESEEESSEEESESESEEESSEEGSDADQHSQKLGDESNEKRLDRDVSVWQNKLGQLKERERISRQERKALRERVLKYHKDIRTERKEYLRVKQELDDMADALREANETFSEEEEESGSEESTASDADDGDWWLDEPKKKPKKLKKKKIKVNGEDESLIEEDLTDMSKLSDPVWNDIDAEESETDDEDDPLNMRVRKLQARAATHEQSVNSLKKDSHDLKSQVTRCDELYNEEKRRHARLDNELQMLLSAID